MAAMIETEAVDGIAIVRIRKPPANALDPALLAESAAVTERLRAERPAAVVLAGSGGFFSAGVDLKLAPTLTAAQQASMVTAINRLFYDWYSLAHPVVAAVNGHAVAGGLILALCADHRVGSLAASYGLTELKVGTPYPLGALAVVRAELEPRAARRLVLGADLIGAAEAAELGLLDELAEPDDVLEAALEAATKLAALPAGTYERVKLQLRAPTLEAIRVALAHDPLTDGWLSDETRSAARGALDRSART